MLATQIKDKRYPFKSQAEKTRASKSTARANEVEINPTNTGEEGMSLRKSTALFIGQCSRSLSV